MRNFNKFLYRPFGKTIYDFSLVKDGEKILLCLSGGKDSTVMAELFSRWKKKVPIKISLEAVYIDFFGNNNIKIFLEKLCKKLNIPFEAIYIDSAEKAILNSGKFSKCYVCARERRMNIFKYARNKKIRKIAYAHTRNDFSETLFMNMIYSGHISTLSIKKDFFAGEFEIIRPLALIDESIINEFIRASKIIIPKKKCKYYMNNRREVVRNIFKGLEKDNLMVSQSLNAAIRIWLSENFNQI